MIQRKLVFCIDNNIKFVSGSIPATKLTANDINRDVIYVVAPFEISSVIKVKFADELNQQENVSQLLKYTNEVSVDELVDKTKPYYETVKDWNVYYIEMSGKPLSFVSNRISSGIYISFSVVITNPKTNLVSGLNFIGYEYGESLETPLNNGEYKIIRNPLFEEDGVSYNVDDIIYKENGDYFRVSASIRKGGTTGIKYLVEPNISAIDESLDPTLTEQIIEMVTDLEQDVAHISRNAILKDGSVAMEDDLDLGGNSLNNVNEVKVGKISANGGTYIEIVDDIDMQGKSIYTADEIESELGVFHNVNVNEIKVDRISANGNPFIEVSDDIDMNGKGVYGAGEVEGEVGTFNNSLTKGGKEVATIEYVDNKDIAIMNKANSLENANMFKDVSYNNVNGVLTFTRYDDTTKQIDLPLELLVESGYYDEITNELVLVLANGSEIRIPVGNLLTDLDAHNIRFNGSGTNYLVNKLDVESAVKELDIRVKGTVEEANSDGKIYGRKDKSWVEITSDDSGYEPDGVTIVLNNSDELEVSKDLEVEWTKVVNKPTFSTVATTGSYNDLSGKPDLTAKLDKNFSALPNQASPLLTDVLVINRGTVAQKTTLGNLLAQVDAEIFIIVSTLPASGLENKIYLVPKTSPDTNDGYDEYIWNDSAWELLGSLTLDLSNYYNKTEVNGLLSSKVDKNNAITAGTKTKITYDSKGLVTSGADLVATDIPNLDTDKITTGTFADARIPNLNASKINAGTFDAARIPNLAPSKITQDASNRFVTDTEKSTWNSKQSALGFTPENQANKKTTLTNNDVDFPTTKAVKTAIDTAISQTLKPMGNWNASTNTPTLINSDTSKANQVYYVSVAGTQFGINFDVGDELVYNTNGVIFKRDNVDAVISVNGKEGVVVLTQDDVADGSTYKRVTENEKTTWNNKVDSNAAITGATKTKITYDSKGLVTAGADLVATDIPTLEISKITGLQTALDDKLDKNNAITGSTKTKITYDAKGLVTGGSDLVESDIPQLAPSKITQDANNRFVTDTQISTWNAKQSALPTITQAQINAGTATTAVTITPKLLRDNFYTETEIDNMIGDIESVLDTILGV